MHFISSEFINPLAPEFCFPLILLIGTFFDDPFLFKIEILAIPTKYSGSLTNGLIEM